MRKYLLFLAVLLIPGLAIAGWNIKQNPDGSTTWIDQDSVQVPVGESGLTVRIADLSTAATSYVTSHKAGHIAAVYVTQSAALTAQSDDYVLTINVAASNSDPFLTVGSGGSNTITSAATGTAGAVSSITFTRSATNNVVGQGDVIAVHTDGGSTGTAIGTVTIVVQ